jgi:putative oxidoreductase
LYALSDTMQRLFSTFPNSWPGLGLLILRCALASSCIGIEMQTAEAGPRIALFLLAPIVCGGLLIGGLWTPITATALAILLVWSGVSARPIDPLPFILAATAVSLAMLGPGAWSLDAALFGRKRIDMRHRGSDG